MDAPLVHWLTKSEDCRPITIVSFSVYPPTNYCLDSLLHQASLNFWDSVKFIFATSLNCFATPLNCFATSLNCFATSLNCLQLH